MEYLLKSSAVIALFYLCYKVFLQRETFFEGNRWFLLSGLFLAMLVPLIIIPIYIEAVSVPVAYIISGTNIETPSTPTEASFDFFQLIPWIYFCGLAFFIGKLALEFISLFRLIKKHPTHKLKSITYIETINDLAPFSFFKWIVYNSTQFNLDELALILKHESVHARQFHSVDVILAQIACAILWFNPFVWLYKKALQQNLEFIADAATQNNISCEKSYQNLLLKTSISNHTLTMTNTFYNSLIKKRIVMLHKSKSKKINAIKYALVLPLLVLFVFNFNTEIIAQTTNPEPDKVSIGQNVLKFIITKDTKDTQLESIKAKLLEKKASITFEDLRRNERHELTDIKINYEHDGKSGVFFRKSENPIVDIAILLNVDENELSVGEAKQNLSQSFAIIKEDGETKLKKEEDTDNVYVYSTDDDEKDNDVKVVGKDGEEHSVKKEKQVYLIKSASTKNSDGTVDSIFIRKNTKDTIWIKSDVKNIVWTDENGHVTTINTSESGKNLNTYFTNGKKQPLLIVDGKRVFTDEFSKINPNNIAIMNVLKGDKGIETYGENGKDGVIIVTTKNNASFSGVDKAIVVNETKSDNSSKEKSGPWTIGPTVRGTTYDDNNNSESFTASYIDKDTSDKALEDIKKDLKTENVTFSYSRLLRNKDGRIVRIRIEISTGKSSKILTFLNPDGISKILFGINNGKLFLNQSE